MKIPEVRDELLGLATLLRNSKGRNWRAAALKIEELVPELIRRTPKRRVKIITRGLKRSPLTDAKRREITDFARLHPDWMLQEIAVKYGVNQGRVSEIIAGFRK